MLKPLLIVPVGIISMFILSQIFSMTPNVVSGIVLLAFGYLGVTVLMLLKKINFSFQKEIVYIAMFFFGVILGCTFLFYTSYFTITVPPLSQLTIGNTSLLALAMSALIVVKYYFNLLKKPLA